MFYLAYRKRKIKNETSISVFEKVRGEYAVLLHSGKRDRYSFIGYEPFMALVSRDNSHQISVFNYLKDEVVADVQILEGDTLALFQGLMDQMKVHHTDKDLPPFVGGGVGFLSYEFGLKMHGITPANTDDLSIPDLHYAFYDKVIAFDHEAKDIYFFGVADHQDKAQKLAAQVMKEAAEGLGFLEQSEQHHFSRGANFIANVDRDLYIQKINSIQKYLKNGDTYQVNFSYRFVFDTDRDPWLLYRKLAETNPSPQSCFFDFSDIKLVSSSPERLVSLCGRILQTQPIKGTRQRGKTKVDDVRLEKDLLHSEKDEAELSMIVDLARNDLGMVCEPGSVRVVKHRDIEKYSHVMHTVSTVEGRLRKGIGVSDIIRAVFPGGSVTGCPKKRTMEIIHGLEELARDVYCGSAGYVSMSGNMDLNILIRTLLWKDGTVYFHSGGGVVVDSDAESEFQETLDKAQALMAVLMEG